MTPFDPVALLAMLQAFYPVVGPAALRTARTERAAYFAAGELIGRFEDALKLPDGRIFDCIFDVMGPHTRWQCIEVGDATNAPDDPFALEAGPLVPIDLSAWQQDTTTPVFLPLVAARLGELGGTGAILDTAHGEIVQHSDKGPLQDAWAAHMDPAIEHLGSAGIALDQMDPSSELAFAAAQQEAIATLEADYYENV